MFRRTGVFGVVLLVGACSSNPTPSPTNPTAVDIPASVSGPLSANLSALAQSLSGQSALAAQGAALALQAGVQAVPVTLTGNVVAAPPAGSRSSALQTGGSAYAFAYQITVMNTPTGSPPSGVYTGVVAYVDPTDFAFAMGTSQGMTTGDFAAGTAIGSIFAGGDTKIWHATRGNESSQLITPGAACTGSLPSHVTACTNASFTAGLDIVTSTSTVVGDTSSKTVNWSGNNVPGVALTVDYTQVSLSITVSPASATVPPGGTYQFEAYVTGTSDTPVWSVQEGAVGGMVSPTTGSSTTYTAAGAGGPYHVVASVGGKSGTAVVTVSAPAPRLQGYWQGSYAITPTGFPQVSGSDTFVMQDSAQGCPVAGSTCLYFDFLCTMPTLLATYLPAGDSSATAFTIQSSTCTQPNPGSACPGATFTLTGGSGSIDVNGKLNVTTLTGTTNGLWGTPCGQSTSFTGSFVLGISVN